MRADRISLPVNARKWIDRSLPEDFEFKNRITNTQEGEILVRDKWYSFSATTEYQAQTVFYNWTARINIMFGVWVKAVDSHNDNTGWGGAKMWGVFPLGGSSGMKVFQMQLVRHLAELAWAPQLVLLSPDLVIDDTENGFKISVQLGGQNATINFVLNENHEIIKAFGKRYYETPEDFNIAAWHYIFSDHSVLGGVYVPTRAIGVYEKPEGEWKYWSNKLISIEQ
ncbi:MAG: DUF6544 family protein [Thermodesulfobacteriota bacterium]